MGLTSWEKGKLQYKPGDVYQGVDYQMYRMGDTIGHLKAIDVANKKVLWDVPSPLPFFSGMLATKGGVVFTGDQRGRLLAYNSKTGKEVWKFQTGSAINASPITYELDGKQYVAILSGLGGDPSFYYSAPKGGMLWVFAIDGKVDEGGSVQRAGDRQDAACCEALILVSMRMSAIRGSTSLSLVSGGDGAVNDEPRLRGR